MSGQKKRNSDFLGPSTFSARGFMGNDRRAPDEIIRQDGDTLFKMGVTKERLSQALLSVFDKAQAALGDKIDLAPGLCGVYRESRGRIPSPFAGDTTFEKGEVEIGDAPSGEQMILTKLSLHLIGRHGFFQGKGCRFRIDPEKAVCLLRKHGLL